MNFLSSTTSAAAIAQLPEFNVSFVVFNLSLSFLLSALIAYTYKRTHRGLSYSQSFVVMLVILGVIMSAVIMIIGNSIALAFGAFGAFSLIRFRTAIKDAKDLGYVFFVLAVGMAVGSGNYHIALTLTIIVLAIILVLTRINFGTIRKFDYILTFSFNTKIGSESGYRMVFDKYLKNSSILNIKTLAEPHILHLSFSVRFVNEKESLEFVNNLKQADGVTNANLITVKNDIEY